MFVYPVRIFKQFIKTAAVLCILAVFFIGLPSCFRRTPLENGGAGTGADTAPAAEKRTPEPTPAAKAQKIIHAAGVTVAERFTAPEGFERTPAGPESFGAYLRKLPLKPDGTPVQYFDGRVKEKSGVYAGVVDMDIGNRDLQQCADAVMRLRAEYLYGQGRFGEIHFHFLNGFQTEYKKWTEGYRIAVSGNNTRWVKSANPSNTYRDFRNYMDMVFAYANTVSLKKELKAVEIKDMEVGDVFIDEGHAIIVMDMVENKASGKKMFLLAQSYMPAQDTQILQNPSNERLSPWYDLDFGDTLRTPEWTFKKEDLHRFP